MASIIGTKNMATKSCPMPDTVRARRVSSTLHYATTMEVSDGRLDAELTEADWLAEVKMAWDIGADKKGVEDRLDDIRLRMVTAFESKGEKAAATELYNRLIRQGCWGYPGYCRVAMEEADKASRKKRRKPTFTGKGRMAVAS